MLYQVKNSTLLTEFDWERTQYIFQELWNLVSAGDMKDRFYYDEDYKANTYSLGNYGGVIENFSLTRGSPWITWTGPLLESVIPWTTDLKNKLQNSGLDFVNFTYTRHLVDIDKHIDGKSKSERIDILNSGQGHCNINYMIYCENPDSYTYVEDEKGNRSTYQSTPGTAWLLQTDVPHGVVNKGRREAFQIKFHSSFDKVKHWLEKNPDFLNA